MKKLLIVLSTLVLFLYFSTKGMACSIAGDPPEFQIKNDFDRATLIFAGEFQEAKRIETMPALPPNIIDSRYSYDVEVTFKITKNYKGMYGKGRLIKIRTSIDDGTGCAFGIREWETEKPGTNWLVYAILYLPSETTGEVLLHSGSLSPTSRMKDADKEVLKFLDKDVAERKSRGMYLPD